MRDNQIKIIKTSFIISLKHIVRFKQALLGGLAMAILLFLTAYSSGTSLNENDIIPYVASWYGMASYLILATVCSSFILFVYESLPSLVFLDKFSRLKFWHFILGLLISFIVISFVVLGITYLFGISLMYVIGHQIKVIYIKNPRLLIGDIFVIIFFVYSFNILFSVLSRLSHGKLLTAFLNGSFLIVVLASTLQASGIIGEKGIYLIPFNAIITLLLIASVGQVPETNNLFISLVPSSYSLLVLSVILWSTLLLIASIWIFKMKEPHMAEDV